MNKLIYDLKNVNVCYKHHSIFNRNKNSNWALYDLNFSIFQGETVGVIGKNGAGKSTLLRLFARIIDCDSGEFECHAKRITMLSIGAGFDSYLTGRDNIGLNGRLLGIPPHKLKKLYPAIIELSGIGDAIEMPVRTYSTGMRARLGFAIAYYADPEVLLLDENLGVGDADFQKKSTALIKEKINNEHQTAILVSHSIPLIKELCTKAILLDKGILKKVGNVDDVINEYLQK